MGNRTLTAGMDTASKADVVRPVPFSEMDFASGIVRFNGAPYEVASWFGGDPFIGVGQFGSIGVAEENSELEASSHTFTIRGIPNDKVSTALNEHYQGRPCKLWWGLLDGDHQLIADPALVFSGLMDTMDITAGETSTITVTAQSYLARWETPSNLRYTNDSQQLRFPGDKGLEFVPQMVEKEIPWGG